MKKNVVVIGYGGMGGNFHAARALKSDVLNLLGVYDIDEKRCAEAQEKGIFVYDSLDAVLADERVEIVIVAVPNDDHLGIVVRALEAGKHVVCEKPVALSLDELDQMIAASKKSGKLFTVHQNRRFDEDFRLIKKIVDEGVIGAPLRIESRVHGSRGIPGDWRGMKKHGGGMMLDWGVHLIDQALQIIKEPISKIHCTMTNYTNKEVDDGFYLTITFASGVEYYVEVGTYNFISLPRFYMKAENGSAMIRDWLGSAEISKCKYWYEGEVKPVQTAAGLTKTMAPRDIVSTENFEIEPEKFDVHDYFRNFCRAIDGEEEMLVKHDEARLVMRVMELAFLSAEQGTTVDFSI